MYADSYEMRSAYDNGFYDATEQAIISLAEYLHVQSCANSHTAILVADRPYWVDQARGILTADPE